jgi:hypothetical protein
MGNKNRISVTQELGGENNMIIKNLQEDLGQQINMYIIIFSF